MKLVVEEAGSPGLVDYLEKRATATGEGGPAPPALVPLRKPPNSSDKTIRTTISAMIQSKQPMSLGLGRRSLGLISLLVKRPGMSPPAAGWG
jgi:hypothetical protein